VAASEAESEVWRVLWRLVKWTVKCEGYRGGLACEADRKVWMLLWRLVKRTVKCGGYCGGL